MIPKNRCPSHPGEIIREMLYDRVEQSDFKFGDDRDLKQVKIDLTNQMGPGSVSIQFLNSLINCRSSVSALTALRLSYAFGTTPQFWLNLQNSYDLWHAHKYLKTLSK